MKIKMNNKNILRIAFLMPSVVILLMFTYVPAMRMVFYSFTDWDGIGNAAQWVGLKNYIYIFNNPELFDPLKVSAIYLIASFIQIFVALILATLLSYKLRGLSVFKGLYFFPTIINSVAISFMFILYFKPGGTLDSTLLLLGIENNIKWLGDPKIVNISLAYASVWRYIGLNIVMFSSAISSLSTDVFEAAKVDGVGKIKELRHIIIPGVKRVIQINLFLAITGALTVFEMPFIITEGGNGSETFVIQSLDLAFSIRRAGLACALSIMLILMIIIVSLLQRWYFQWRSNE